MPAFPQTRTETPFSATCLIQPLDRFPSHYQYRVFESQDWANHQIKDQERFTSFLRTSSDPPPQPIGPPRVMYPRNTQRNLLEVGACFEEHIPAAQIQNADNSC